MASKKLIILVLFHNVKKKVQAASIILWQPTLEAVILILWAIFFFEAYIQSSCGNSNGFAIFIKNTHSKLG